MSAFKCFVGGLIGALIGAAIWAAIYHYADFELGLVAWGVGILAGIGVRVAMYDSSCNMSGVIALLCAVVGLVGGKYAGVSLDVNEYIGENFSETDMRHHARVLLADEIVDAWAAEGRAINWPPGMTQEDAWERSDYPADVWQEMSEAWDAMSETEREGRLDDAEFTIESFTSSLKTDVFWDSFSLFDGVWFLLALGSAWKIAEDDNGMF